MSDDQDGCEWVNVSSGTSPGSLGQRAVKRLCMYVMPHRRVQTIVWFLC